MALTIRRTNYGSDHGASPPLLAPRGTFARVEARLENLAVVDGVALDLRGLRAAGGVTHDKLAEAFGGVGPHVRLSRLAGGDHLLEIVTTDAGIVSSGPADSMAGAFPHAVIGAVGEAITSTAPGSVTLTAGGRTAWRRVHEQGDAWAAGLDGLAGRHLASEVQKGHDWLTVGIHRSAWMVANNATLTWAAKMAWAERVIRGAADITTPAEFYAASEGIPAPVGLQTWVNPATGAAVNLAAAVTITPGSGGYPAVPASWSLALAEGAWVNGWTA